MKYSKDNYYIITGHTYDEYIKKYHNKYGKGKYLIFKADELQYLNKHKFYWEVVGPKGETLYCQVRRLKPHHIIIPVVVAGLLGGGGYCVWRFVIPHFDGTVTEEQWKNSLENIAHIKDRSRTLNYTTKSSFQLIDSSSNVGMHIKNLIVDGDLEQATDGNTGKTLYMYNYKHLPLKYVDGDESVTTWTCMLHDYLAIPFGDFYTSKDQFKYDVDTRTYSYSADKSEYEGTELQNIKSSISFASPSSVKKVSCSFDLMNGKGEIAETFEGEFEYTFGNAKLEAWDKDVVAELNNRTFSVSSTIENNKLIPMQDSGTYKGYKTKENALESYNENQPFIVTLDYKTNPDLIAGLKYFKLKNSEGININFWQQNLEIYKNDNRLEKNTDWKTTFEGEEGQRVPVGFELFEAPTSNDVITIKTSIWSKYFESGCYLTISIE